jgi:hypothetical protein
MIIGSPVEQLSGPVKISHLQPTTTTSPKNSFPTILIFHDEHESKQGDCNSTEDGCFRLNDCYNINDHEFLRLFDKFSTPDYPIHFYIEQHFDPFLKSVASRGHSDDYISDFLHRYKACYLKKSVQRDKDCPTKHCQWHFIDTRFAVSGNNEDKYLYKGILLARELIERYLSGKGKFNAFYDYCKHLSTTDKKGLQYVMEWLDGPSFIERYITRDSNFLISKQISKMERFGNYRLWQDILIQSQRRYLAHYLQGEGDDVVQTFHNILMTYRDILELVLNIQTIDEPDQLFTKYKELLEPHDVSASDSFYNLFNLYVFITGSAFLDVYTISRMMKNKKKKKNPYLCCVYVGRHHAEEMKKVLMDSFDYTLKGESEPVTKEDIRCQRTEELQFDIQNVLQRYKK